MLLNKIKKQLGLLTKDMDKAQKLKFLKTIGYSGFGDIEKLSDEKKEDLYNFLLTKDSNSEYEIYEKNGYTISRPKNPKSVKDISFTFKGMKK